MLMLDRDRRARLWARVMEAIEDYNLRIPDHRVTPRLDAQQIRALLAPFDFGQALDPVDAVDFIVAGLWEHQVHPPHPRYFGLFNPAPATMGIVADTIVAAFNPQLAAWSHSPLAAEIEQHLIRAFGARFGYEGQSADGTFTSGGAEANHTALLTALFHAFPTIAQAGLRALPKEPVFYASAEGHHSLRKAARLAGLGTDALREVPVDDHLRMDLAALRAAIERDRAEGRLPFLAVATAGSTAAGVLDPLSAIADVAAGAGLWLHVDAAWGGAAALVPELRALLAGIERADSITFDAHKFLSVPMGAGMFLTRHPDVLARTFGIATGYMPHDAAGMAIVDPYAHSMQWSRRFIGLKVFLSLAVAGWEGYAETIRGQVALGQYLRGQLQAAGWTVVNDTPLPVVCFVDNGRPEDDAGYLEAIVRTLLATGEAWISTARARGRPVLRACITNYRTQMADVDALVGALDRARAQARATLPQEKPPS